MTTNVYDRSRLRMTSDSRWSVDSDFGAVLYVDDTGFDKIVIAAEHAFLFAGSAPVIQEWKDFLRKMEEGEVLPRPSAKGIALLMAKLSCGTIIASYGHDIALPSKDSLDASFAGSGARFAAKCWEKNKCSHRAVETAKASDPYSGGQVMYLELDSRETNIQNSSNVVELPRALIDKGMVMYKSAPTVVQQLSITEAAKNDPRIQDLLKEIASGTVEIQAPCDSMLSTPTQEENERIDKALAIIFSK